MRQHTLFAVLRVTVPDDVGAMQAAARLENGLTRVGKYPATQHYGDVEVDDVTVVVAARDAEKYAVETHGYVPEGSRP